MPTPHPMMSKRFYAGPVSIGMGRSADDWIEPGLAARIESQLQHWRAALADLNGTLPMRAAPPLGTRHQLVDPIGPRR